MTEWLKLDNDTRTRSLDQASYEEGIPSKAVEKDWWVTLTLKALFQSKYESYIIFKGGTSLSKCWKLIQRFSEDIDIALSAEAFGMEYKENPTNSFLSKLKRAGCEFTSNELKVELGKQFAALGIPAGMVTIEAAPVKANMPDTDPQTLLIKYPSLFEPDKYLIDVVKVEVSVRSLKEPYDKVEIQSVLNENNPEVHKETPFKVTVVKPERTFLEKMFLLHEEFQKSDFAKIRSQRMSRHLYDLVQMMNSEAGSKALADKDLYHTIIKHRSIYNAISKLDYTGHSPDKICFIPPINIVDAYHEDYDQMKEVMIYGAVPEFGDLIAGLTELLRRFRSLSEKELLRKEFEPLAGTYIRWWEDDKTKGENRVFAKANIKYDSDIRYTIDVSTLIYYGKDGSYGTNYTEDQIEVWTGELIMETATTGTIIWNQKKPKSGAKGYKKISIEKDLNKVTLIGEKSKGYGYEIFTDKEV